MKQEAPIDLWLYETEAFDTNSKTPDSSFCIRKSQNGNIGIAGGHDSFKEAFGRDAVFTCYPYKYFRPLYLKIA